MKYLIKTLFGKAHCQLISRRKHHGTGSWEKHDNSDLVDNESFESKVNPIKHMPKVSSH